MESVHEPVLLHEIVEAFAAPRSELGAKSYEKDSYLIPHTSSVTYLDGTLGGAGHALAIAKAFQGKLTVIGLDRDLEAVKRAEKSLQGKADKVILENQDYRTLDEVLKKHDIPGVDLILLDLGISSDELDNSGRGFTFQKDEPLFMTMGDPAKYPFTAQTIVNEWEEEVIADVIFGYGEERFARRIAKAIIAYRGKKKIETTGELAEIISSSVPGFYKRGKIHPATRTFQAIRIAVNDELNALKEGLDKGYAALTTGGRMAIISFHSLEDRIVKDFYKKKALYGSKILTKKPIVASDQERVENPRSRSAKLRILEK
ncbi:MAG: 16S rRNA (cytosine(1402)-N(4))-methyltransferase RsmH [Candidatus Pacebacteria bacterium]|nr:16S rRNA (cytosine(1402)-N(4))-methyltransferase RsmH [Candidatus Paceibacterota bacterium]